ncbi:MAG: branched-chain amino acid ABC transporter permease [Deltaproteobacteria bacterium]|nr:branched-chain amino acid ABC transporter permease [Deltaproteobacteria bacterium]
MRGWERAKFFVIRHHTGIAVWVLAIILLLTPLVVSNPYNLGILNLIGLYVIVVLGLNLFIGYAGQISLGHAAFFGLGAYGSAVLTAGYNFPAWPAMGLTAAVLALVALALGVPTLRLSGHYLAMATLGFNYVVHGVFVQWDAVTGGPAGLSGVPPLSILGFAFNSDIKFHYLVWTCALAALTLCLNLVRSGVGRGLAALAQDEVAAATLGVNVQRDKVQVFVLSAVFASVAGSLYAHYFGYVNPDGFSIFKSLDLVIMVVVGGMGSIWGTLFGVALITILPHFLEFFETYMDIIHGLILVVILLFLPQGFVSGLVDYFRMRVAKRRLKLGAVKGNTSL